MRKARRVIAAAWKDSVGSRLTAEVIVWIACILGLPGLVLAISTTVRTVFLNAVVSLFGWMQAATPVSNWMLVVLGLVGGWQMLSCSLWLARRRGVSSAIPGWRNYTSDEYDGIKWVWTVGEQGFPFDFRPRCVTCDCELQLCEGGHSVAPMSAAACEHCGHRVGPIPGSIDQLERRARRFAEMGLRKRGAVIS
jgi:hypothetical protein